MSERKRKIVDKGELRINADYAEWFDFNGLLRVRDIVSWPERKVIKDAAKDRYTMRLTLPGPKGSSKHFIVKHFRARPVLERFLEIMNPFSRSGGAAQEWDAMWMFLEIGLPGPVPVAWGAAHGQGVVVSEAVAHVMKLDQWAERNRVLWEIKDQEALRIKNELIRLLAKIVGTMHKKGLHHQDLYLCHFLCGSEKYGYPITLIDLQRVRRYRQLPKRWLVKDLAQLHFSSENFVTNEDRELFWETYKEAHGGTITWKEKALIGSIVKKSRRIRNHTKKHGL